jgi:TonB family protein
MNTAIHSCEKQNGKALREAIVFVRLLLLLVLLSAFACAQSPADKSSQQSSPPQKTSDKVFTDSEQIMKEELPNPSPLAAERLEKIGRGVSAPVAIKTPPAKYTPEAREKHIEGACLMSVIVDSDGSPQNPKVVRPLGYGLDEAALTAVKKYRFKPAMKNGHPVATQIMIEVKFKLN